jgi:hypothetical protein
MQYTQEYSYFLILSLSIFINIWLLLETPIISILTLKYIKIDDARVSTYYYKACIENRISLK